MSEFNISTSSTCTSTIHIWPLTTTYLAIGTPCICGTLKLESEQMLIDHLKEKLEKEKKLSAAYREGWIEQVEYVRRHYAEGWSEDSFKEIPDEIDHEAKRIAEEK